MASLLAGAWLPGLAALLETESHSIVFSIPSGFVEDANGNIESSAATVVTIPVSLSPASVRDTKALSEFFEPGVNRRQQILNGWVASRTNPKFPTSIRLLNPAIGTLIYNGMEGEAEIRLPGPGSDDVDALIGERFVCRFTPMKAAEAVAPPDPPNPGEDVNLSLDFSDLNHSITVHVF